MSAIVSTTYLFIFSRVKPLVIFEFFFQMSRLGGAYCGGRRNLIIVSLLVLQKSGKVNELVYRFFGQTLHLF